MADAELPKGAEYHYIEGDYTGVYTRVPAALTPGYVTCFVVILISFARLDGTPSSSTLFLVASFFPLAAILIALPAMRRGLRGLLDITRSRRFAVTSFWYANLGMTLLGLLILYGAKLDAVAGIAAASFTCYASSFHVHRIKQALKASTPRM
jgi:energy-converting hydrogenase Eha subunit A